MLRTSTTRLFPLGLAILGSCTCADSSHPAEDGSGHEGTGESGSSGGSDGSASETSETGEPECELPGPNDSCSVWCQDCPAGEKCVPLLDDETFEHTACVAVVEDAKGAGADCEAAWANPPSTGDDCGAGLFCWNPQSDTGKGTCFPFCSGAPDAPGCPSGSRCMQHPGLGELALCMETCDPLTEPTCGDQACAPTDPSCLPPVCFPLGPLAGLFCIDIGTTLPGAGEPCSIVGCRASHICAPAEKVPGCSDGACCTPYCNLDAPDCAAGTCQSVFEPGAAPANIEHVGACLVP
jgi:hypothetical protein